MSTYNITDNERVAALHQLGEQSGFSAHERYVMKLIGFNDDRRGFDTFMTGLDAGNKFELNGDALEGINLDSGATSNVLNLHRREVGRKIKKSDRVRITDEPSISVIKQKEMFYIIGTPEIPISTSLNIAKHVTGEYTDGYNQIEITRRKEQYQECMFGEGATYKNSMYYRHELPNIIKMFHNDLGIDGYEEGSDNYSEQVLEQARRNIRELLQHLHILPTMRDVCLIATRRAVRHLVGQERVAQSPPASGSRFDAESIKKYKEKRRRRKCQKPIAALSLVDRFEDSSAASVSSATRIREDLNHSIEYGKMQNDWSSGDDEKRVEIGRLELLFKGSYNGDSMAVINATVRKYGALPFDIHEYNALNDISNDPVWKKAKKQSLNRKLMNFQKLRDNVINKDRKEFILRDKQPILDWVRFYQLFNDGKVTLPRQMMRNGTITPEATAIIRHILYTHPKIGWCDFNKLLCETAVLFLDRVLKPKEYASLATLRSNIARLDNLDRHELKEQFGKFLSTPSPRGNLVFFGGGSDATLHDKCNVRNVFLVVFDKGPTEEQKEAAEKDPLGWEQYKLNLEIVVASASKAVNYTESNIDALLEYIPSEFLYRYKLHSLDNANSAVKEGRETTAMATEKTVPLDDSKKYIHGVEIQGSIIRDPFHIFQLQCQYFSVAVMGDVEKGVHDFLHHRGLIQSIWNHYIREPELFKRISMKILSSIAPGGISIPFNPKAFREMPTRWGSNARACENILDGMHIRNHEGQCFWELLFLELRAEHTGWRESSIDIILTMFKMESVIFGLYAEFEAGKYFNVHYSWHAQPGEICNRPGMRTLELIFEYLDHCYPFWQSLLRDKNNPDSLSPGWDIHYKLSMNYLRELVKRAADLLIDDKDPNICNLLAQLNGDDIDEDDEQLIHNDIESERMWNQEESSRLLKLVKMKREQLQYGADQSIDELAKLTEDLYDPANIWLFLVHPVHGGGVCRAVLARARMGGLELDNIYSGDSANKDLIKEADTSWGMDMEYDRTGFEQKVFDILEGKEKAVVHKLRMYGLYQCKCRDEMKRLSREFGSPRDNNSSTRLKDFFDDYPNIFDNLHSWFARSMSNTRPIEGAHGFQRSSWDSQRSLKRNDAQLAYLMRIEYDFRFWRRMQAYATMGIDEEDYKIDKNKAVKHANTKQLTSTAAEQLKQWVDTNYTENALQGRFSTEVLEQNSIRHTNKRGMMEKNKKYEREREHASNRTQAKRRSNARYSQKSDAEYAEKAKSLLTKHDEHWVDEPKRRRARQAGLMLVKKWWSSVPKGMFMEELKQVLPNFYKNVSTLKPSDRTQKYILRPTKKDGKGGETPKNSLGEYLKAVKDIAKSKRTNDLMSTADANELEGKSDADILLAFIKVDESDQLANTLQEQEDSVNLMREIISENGSVIAEHQRYKAKEKVFTKYEIGFVHSGPGDDELMDGNLEELGSKWWEYPDDEADDEEVNTDEEEEEEEDNMEEGEEDDRDA